MELINDKGEVIELKVPTSKAKSNLNMSWDYAHQVAEKKYKQNKYYDFYEPNLSSALYDNTEHKESYLIKKSINDGYLHHWPKPDLAVNNFIWHLGEQFSQLAKANGELLAKHKKPKIRIAIIDTGFQPGHPALPINTTNGISFVKSEEGQSAIDINSNQQFEQNGHGTATMCILAGKDISKEMSDGTYSGIFGAIPFAEIIPIRICETVALIRTDAFVKAVEYAINQECEVISMSMAGAPTKAWARVVNKAYECGIIMVTAAGNSWIKGTQKLLPKRVLYPARWDRVIAATGVAFDHKPYVFKARIQGKSEGGEFMQGNYGPKEVMKTALAAYTPNISWATLNQKGKYFRLDGGGTSSATPQIAAAAAIWICYYRDELNKLIPKDEKWRKVEMVKKALFSSANKEAIGSEIYLGQGILKACNALKIKPSNEDLLKANAATVIFDGILDLLGLLIRAKSEVKQLNMQEEMFALEILQFIHNSPDLHQLLDYGQNEKWNQDDIETVKEKILQSEYTSNILKDYLSSI